MPAPTEHEKAARALSLICDVVDSLPSKGTGYLYAHAYIIRDAADRGLSSHALICPVCLQYPRIRLSDGCPKRWYSSCACYCSKDAPTHTEALRDWNDHIPNREF